MSDIGIIHNVNIKFTIVTLLLFILLLGCHTTSNYDFSRKFNHTVMISLLDDFSSEKVTIVTVGIDFEPLTVQDAIFFSTDESNRICGLYGRKPGLVGTKQIRRMDRDKFIRAVNIAEFYNSHRPDYSYANYYRSDVYHIIYACG